MTTEREFFEYRIKPRGGEWSEWNEARMRPDCQASVLHVMGSNGSLTMTLKSGRDVVQYRRRWLGACIKHGCYGCCEMRPCP